MYFLDLATQGVRGFSPNARVALYPGYLVLQPRGSEPIPFSALATALLYAEGGMDASLRVEGAKIAKVAMMLQGNDSVTYRLVRELGGSGSLQRLNKDTHRFEPVTQDLQEMAQCLRTQVGMPTQATFEQLFTLNASQLPSRNMPATKTAALSAPAAAGVIPDLAGDQKLQELSKELELSQKAEQLQSKQDEIASEMFALESVLKGAEGIRATLDEAERAWRSAPSPESLGVPDILDRLERYPELAQKRDAALERLAADREAAESQQQQESAPIEVLPLYRDPRFVASAAIGGACLIAGALLQGTAKYVALLDVPAFGAAALFAMQWVDGNGGTRRSGRRSGRFDAREKRIHAEFEADAEPIRRALKALGVETTDEARNVLAQRAALGERVEALRQQLAEAESDQQFAAAAAKYAELKAQAESITAQLQELAGGYVRESREVQREIDRLRESARTSLGTASAVGGASAQSGSLDDLSARLLAIAAELLQSDIPATAALVKERCAQHLAMLCARRYVAVDFDSAGRATLVAGDKRVPAAELPAADLDLFFLSLRVAIIEKASPKMRMPLLIEELEAIEASKHVLLARLLKQLGTATQVLHVTASPVFVAAADTTATL